jgi:pyrroloquinoline quinone biosynthesis protein E
MVAMTKPSSPPLALIAEVTHACPLHCPYCSNPLDLTRRSQELDTAHWLRLMNQAADLGVVHAHLTGGEPLLRPDAATILAAAHQAGLYTQLVTSGVGLTEDRLDELIQAGVRSVQLSVQDATAPTSDRIAGRRSFADKEHAAALVRKAGLFLVLDVVLHRQNLDSINDIIKLGVAWEVNRLELANVQFYGWALANRRALLPTREQIARAWEQFQRWRESLAGQIELVWLVPDYFEGVAKPCMGGWAAVSLTVAPDGTALPCPAARTLPGLDLPNIKDHSLEWIWQHSTAFNAYRGTAWMNEPCRSCPQREKDHGGCRCQAFAITGTASRTDPACRLAPDHHLICELIEAASTPPPNSHRISWTPRKPSGLPRNIQQPSQNIPIYPGIERNAPVADTTG